MKTKIRQLIALLYIFLLVTSPFAAAQEDDDSQPNQGELNYQQEFQNNPTPENFNQLPNPTAADLVRLGDGATLANFEYLMNKYPQRAGSYLEQRYNNDFAQTFYDDPLRLGLNPALDDKYISGDGSKEISTKNIEHNLPVAATYFTGKFGKKFTVEAIPPGFAFDAQENVVLRILANGEELRYPVIKSEKIIGVRVTSAGVFLDAAEGEGIGEISLAGNRAGAWNYQEGGNLIFVGAQGKENTFSIIGNEATKFNFLEDGSYEIEGPVSGMVNIDNEHKFAEFRNRAGKLIIHSNGNIEARDALVETAKLHLDGRFEYHKDENKVDAYDVMINDRKTIIVDKDSRIGAKTQGQIRGKSTLEVYLSKISENSEYFVKPGAAEEQPTVQEVIENLQKVRPPQVDSETGKLVDKGDNAVVYIKKDTETGKTIVTAKGKVDVGFYDVVSGSTSLSEKEPRFVGVNGISEFDMLSAIAGAQSQVNIRGQAVYSDDQYSRIDTQQNGASLKIIKNDFDDVIHSGCFDCEEGSPALTIGKQVATVVQQGNILGGKLRTITISATATGQGLRYDWDNFLSEIGSLADAKTEGQEIVLGKNLLMKSVVCEGNKQCNFMLARDQESGETSAFYEVYNPETKTFSKPIPIHTNIGKTLGRATLLTSAENVQKLQQIRTLLEQRRFGEVSVLLKNKPFEKDPALQQYLLKETGIDLQQLDNPKYTEKLSIIVKNYDNAQNKISTAREIELVDRDGNKYTINLDESGEPVTPEDQQKLNNLLNKRRRGNERAFFDLYSGAQVDLARAEKEQVEAMHQSCAGNAYCPASDEDVKAAQQKVVAEVLRREQSPEGVEWKQNFDLQKERQKEAEQVNERLADAQKLGKERGGTERELTRDQAVLARTLEDIKEQEAKIEQLKQEREERLKSIQFRDVLGAVFTLGESIEDDKRLESRAEEFAARELYALQQQKFSLENKIGKGNTALKNINDDITGLTLDFKETTSKLALFSASGDDETVGEMIDNSGLPSDKKNELYQQYLGKEVSDRIKSISADKSIPYDERQKQINDIINTGKSALRRAQNYAEQYGDVAGSKVVLDHVAATRPDLVDTSEWRAAQNAHGQARDNQIAELKEAAEQNLREKNKLIDGTEASIFGAQNSIADWTISKLGTAAEGLGSGIRYVSFKAVAGTLAAAGGASYLVGAEETGTDLLDTAAALHTFDDIKNEQANAEIRVLKQQIKSYDQLQEIIIDAWQRGEEPDTTLIQNAFRDQVPIVNLAKQMEGQELTVDDQAKAALYNTEQAGLIAGGDEKIAGQYRALREEFKGKSSVADIADARVKEAETKVGPLAKYGIGLTNEQHGLYGEALIDVTVDVTNLIPGVVFVKVGKAAVRIAEITKIAQAAAKIGRAIDIAKDAGKLLTVSNDARRALNDAKKALDAARLAKGLTAAERTADIARAEQKINLARQAIEGEYRASRLGRTTNALSTPLSSDLRAIERLKLAAEDEQFKAAQRLQEVSAQQEAGVVSGYRGSPAEELRIAQEAYTKATQKIEDIGKAKEAYSLAGSDVGNLFEGTALGKQRAVGPGRQKAQRALDEFQAARKAYHDERTFFGAAAVSQETIDNVVRTAKAAEEASFENRLSDTIRGAIGAQRVERNVEKLKVAKIGLSFSGDGKLVAEGVQAGSEEARLVGQTNQLLGDNAVVRNLVGEDIKPLAAAEDIPAPPRKLSEPEFDELEALNQELEARGATYKINEQGSAEININDVVTGDAADLEQLKQKARRVQQLFDEADKKELVRQARARRNAEAALADNDLQSVAQDVKNNLAAKAKGEVDAGVVPEVAGEKAAELPKPTVSTEIRVAAGDDIPRPAAVEEAIDSRSVGTYSILETVQQEGKVSEARGLGRLPEGVTAEENAQRVLAAVPEPGASVKLETLNGNLEEGRVLAADDNGITIELAGRRQKTIPPEDVAKVEVTKRAPERVGVSDSVDGCNFRAAAIYGLALECTFGTDIPTIASARESGPRVISGQREIPFVSTGDSKHDLYLEALSSPGGVSPEMVKKLKLTDGWTGEGAENVVVKITDDRFLTKINEQRRLAKPPKPELKASIDNPLILKIRKEGDPFGNKPEWLQKIHGDLCTAKAATCLEEIDLDRGLWQISEEAKGPDLEQLIESALPETKKAELEGLNSGFTRFRGELRKNADEAKLAVQKRALDKGTEKTELDNIERIYNEKLENAQQIVVNKRQEILQPFYADGKFDAVNYEGKTINVRQKTEQLFAKLKKSDTEVLDAHWRNLKCIDADCTDLVVVDLGAATQGDYSTIAMTDINLNPIAENYARNALTGGNYNIDSSGARRLLEQNLETPGVVTLEEAVVGERKILEEGIASRRAVPEAPAAGEIPACSVGTSAGLTCAVLNPGQEAWRVEREGRTIDAIFEEGKGFSGPAAENLDDLVAVQRARDHQQILARQFPAIKHPNQDTAFIRDLIDADAPDDAMLWLNFKARDGKIHPEDAEVLAKYFMEGRDLPYGIRDVNHLNKFRSDIRSRLELLDFKNYDSNNVVLTGSSTTGRSSKSKIVGEAKIGNPVFGTATGSDYDVGVILTDRQFDELARRVEQQLFQGKNEEAFKLTDQYRRFKKAAADGKLEAFWVGRISKESGWEGSLIDLGRKYDVERIQLSFSRQGTKLDEPIKFKLYPEAAGSLPAERTSEVGVSTQRQIEDIVRQSQELASPELRQGLEKVVDSGEYLDDAVRKAANDAALIRRQLGSDYNPDNYVVTVLTDIEQRRIKSIKEGSLKEFNSPLEHQRREALLRLAVEANPNLHWNYDFHSYTSLLTETRQRLQNVLRGASTDFRSAEHLWYNLIGQVAENNPEVQNAVNALRGQKHFTSLPEAQVQQIKRTLETEIDAALRDPEALKNALRRTNIEVDDATAAALAGDYVAGRTGAYDALVQSLKTEGWEKEGAGWALGVPELKRIDFVNGETSVAYRDVIEGNYIVTYLTDRPGAINMQRRSELSAILAEWTPSPGKYQFRYTFAIKGKVGDITHLEEFRGPIGAQRSALTGEVLDGGYTQVWAPRDQHGKILDIVLKNHEEYLQQLAQKYGIDIDAVIQREDVLKSLQRAGLDPEEYKLRVLFQEIAKKEDLTLTFEGATVRIEKISEPVSKPVAEIIPLQNRNLPEVVGTPHPAICGGAIHPGILVGTAIDAGCGLEGIVEGASSGASIPSGVPTGTPRTIANLEEGKSFRVRSKSGVTYQGKFLGAEDELITIQTGEKKRFFGLFGTKPETETLRIENLDPSTLIREGDDIGIVSFSGERHFGFYAGEDAESLRVIGLDLTEIPPLSKKDLNFDTLISSGDEVEIKTTYGASYRGFYAGQSKGSFVIKNEDGVNLLLDPKKLDFNSLQRIKSSEEGALLDEVQQIDLPSCPVGGALTGQAAATPCVSARAPRTIANLEEGKSFRVRSKSGNSYGGIYHSVSDDKNVINFQTGERKSFFRRLFGKEEKTETLRVANLDQSSVIKERDEIRIVGNNGVPYIGKYAGEDAEFFRITYENGDTVRFRKDDLDFNSLVGEGEFVTLKSKSGNVYSGRYVTEARGNIILRDEAGKNTFALKSDKVDRSSIKPAGAQVRDAKNKLYADLFADPVKFPSHQDAGKQAKNLIFADEGTPRQVVYGLEDRIVAERGGLIFENVLPSQLPPGEYTYVILEDGTMVFGKVESNLELGVKHFHIANGKPVKAAGEVAIDETGKYVFNLQSGTFTLPIRDKKFDQFKHLGTAAAQQEVAKFDAALQKNVDAVFQNYFGRKGDYIKYSVLPNEPSSLDELVDICVRNSGLNLPVCGSDDLKILVEQREGMVVNNHVVERCAVAGRAIVGLVGCNPPSFRDVGEVIDGPLPSSDTPTVSGVRLKITSTQRTTEIPPEWKDAVQDPTQFAKIREKAAGKEIQIGEAQDFTFIDSNGNLVEGSQKLRFQESIFSEDVFYLKVVDSKTGETIATHDYAIINDQELGKVFDIGATVVGDQYRQAGINQRLFQQMSDLHPDVNTVRSSLAIDNERIYWKAIDAGDTPLEAIKKTPAYKVREAAGWEIDVAHSNLPYKFVAKRKISTPATVRSPELVEVPTARPGEVPVVEASDLVREPSGRFRFGDREYDVTADGVLKEKRPWYQSDRIVDPDSEEFAQVRGVAFLEESFPEVIVTIPDDGDVIYRIADKTYYPTADGRSWKEQGDSLWRKIIGDKTVPEDSIIAKQLDEVKGRIRTEPDGTRVLVSPAFEAPPSRPIFVGDEEAAEDIIESNKRLLGSVAEDPRVDEALESLPIPLNCKRSVVGRAAGTCLPVAETSDPRDIEKIEEINKALREQGRPEIEIIGEVSEPVSGVRTITPDTLFEAAPLGYFNDLEELQRDPILSGHYDFLPLFTSDSKFDTQLINVHGSHNDYLQKYETITQENEVLLHLHQQFTAKEIPEPGLTNPSVGYAKPAALAFHQEGKIYYRQFHNDEDIFNYALLFFGYKGSDIQEAKLIIAERQIKVVAGHETYHHTYRKLLTPTNRGAWELTVKRDPNFQNAAQALRKLGYREEEIVEELFTFRMHGHAFGEPDLSEFSFIARDDELNLLKDVGVLPSDFKRRTDAVYVGEGIYELGGKKYYRTNDGNWHQQRTLWFDTEVDDPDITQELYIERLNAFPQRLAVE